MARSDDGAVASSEGSLRSQSSDGVWSNSDGLSANAALYSGDKLSRFDSQGMSGAASGASAASYASQMFSEEFNAEERVSWSPLRKHVYALVDSKWFGALILVIIFINTILIAVQTDARIEMAAQWYFDVVDNWFLGIYVFELFAKLFVFRSRFRKSGWNLFDAFIVATSFIEYVQFLVASATTINPKVFRLLRVFRAIRALRALRVLRTISFLDNLQVIVNTLLSSIPAMGNVILLLLLIMYIFSLIGTTLYRDAYPSRFGNLFRSFFTMFQILTLDDWFGHYDTLRPIDPFSLLYFIAFIILATFILINLFIAVLVSSLEQSQRQSKQQRKKDDRAARKARAAAKKAREARLDSQDETRITDSDDGKSSMGGSDGGSNGGHDDNGAKRGGGRGDGGRGGGVGAKGNPPPPSKVGTESNFGSHGRNANGKTGAADGDKNAGGPDGEGNARTVEDYYPPLSMPNRQRQLTGYYFMLLASLEGTHDTYLAQQRVLDELVDATVKAEEEDDE